MQFHESIYYYRNIIIAIANTSWCHKHDHHHWRDDPAAAAFTSEMKKVQQVVSQVMATRTELEKFNCEELTELLSGRLGEDIIDDPGSESE